MTKEKAEETTKPKMVVAPEKQTQEAALLFLKSEAAKAGKSFEDWLQEDLKPVLEKTWEIQQKTGKPVSIDDLMEALD